MSIYILKQSEQVTGSFDNGAIIENKPIGFPQESGKLKPYSNLFYWANATSKAGGLIDIHPHQGFEILSFILEGEIVHYDTKLNHWLRLEAGDVQIIRAGNGVSHAEKFLPGGRIFQIWFDPDLHQSLQKPASYNDYKKSDFPILQCQNYSVKIFKGENAPIIMQSDGVEIFEYNFQPGNHIIHLDSNYIYSAYLIQGSLILNNLDYLESDDFLKIEMESEFAFNTNERCKLFVIKSPSKLSYKTYFDLRN